MIYYACIDISCIISCRCRDIAIYIIYCILIQLFLSRLEFKVAPQSAWLVWLVVLGDPNLDKLSGNHSLGHSYGKWPFIVDVPIENCDFL